MRSFVAALGFAVISALCLSAAAQSGGAIVAKGPGLAGAAGTVRLTATITAIDAATRTVTLKGPQGNEFSVVAGPDVRNFAQMKVGDKVDVQYLEALMIELRKGSTAPVSRTESAAVGAAKPGALPAGMAGRQVTVTAEVVAVDPARQVVTLRGPQRTVEVKVKDPAQFKLVAKGDRVEATYTQAVAIAVGPAKN
jgi:Cu/Ag efflux protein CusF